jgi:hypothetical protein
LKRVVRNAGAPVIWEERGFVVLPKHLSTSEIGPAVGDLGALFPTADEFHDDVDPDRNAKYRNDEFAGISVFPFASIEWSLLAVHPKLVELAEAILGSHDIRIYSAEAWAKYTGAADYEQDHHRDFLNHTILVPNADPAFRQLEMFVYLSDVTEDLGAPRFVPRAEGARVALLPNWPARHDHPELYEAEESGAGPAGTVVAYSIDTFHRGTALTAPRGARYTIHVSYRAAGTEWGHRYAWANRTHEPAWSAFVERASPRQLLLLGFPPPGHPFWSDRALRDMAARYPRLDLSPWY